MDPLASEVTCHSGYSYAQRPHTFTWQGKTLTVRAVISEEHSPQGKKFLVKTPEGDLYHLEYDINNDQWLAGKAYRPANSRRMS